jgi:hypothetical protein
VEEGPQGKGLSGEVQWSFIRLVFHLIETSPKSGGNLGSVPTFPRWVSLNSKDRVLNTRVMDPKHESWELTYREKLPCVLNGDNQKRCPKKEGQIVGFL